MPARHMSEFPCVEVDREPDGRICQGDLIRNVACIEDVIQKGDYIEVRRIVFPMIVVLTQDCDLQQDESGRWPEPQGRLSDNARVLSVLVAPLYNLAQFEQGDHLSELGLKMRDFRTGKKGLTTDEKNLRQNETPRYHCLQFPSNMGLVPQVIDFKHYFSVNSVRLRREKQSNFVCKLGSLYREQVSHRFAFYLARIGLPNLARPVQ